MVFVIFGVKLRFFHLKTAIISSEKPTGQRISAVLSVFHILIHEVYRKFDKNYIKTVKIGKFLVFVISGVNLRSFPSGKQQLSLNRRLLDDNFVPC